MSRWARSRARRVGDFAIALLLLALLLVPMLVIALAVRCTSPGAALFRQQRLGREGRLFRILKFRTMAAQHPGCGLSRHDDQGITSCGRLLRRFKLDELPQIANVLTGEMGLVGPRPKLPQFAGNPAMSCRPGITGLASLAFRCEEQILAGVATQRLQPFYDEHIKPRKARLDVCYMCRATPLSDLRILFATAAGSLFPAVIPFLLGAHSGRRSLLPTVLQSEEGSAD